jgi:hypothetical protein
MMIALPLSTTTENVASSTGGGALVTVDEIGVERLAYAVRWRGVKVIEKRASA